MAVLAVTCMIRAVVNQPNSSHTEELFPNSCPNQRPYPVGYFLYIRRPTMLEKLRHVGTEFGLLQSVDRLGNKPSFLQGGQGGPEMEKKLLKRKCVGAR